VSLKRFFPANGGLLKIVATLRYDDARPSRTGGFPLVSFWLKTMGCGATLALD
jgi:hypothetical protein